MYVSPSISVTRLTLPLSLRLFGVCAFFGFTCWCCCVVFSLCVSVSLRRSLCLFPSLLLFIHFWLCQICRLLNESLTRLTTTRTLPYTFNHHYSVFIWSAICSIEYTTNAQSALLHLRLAYTAFFHKPNQRTN